MPATETAQRLVDDAVRKLAELGTREGGTLVRWVLVADWMGVDGERQLDRLNSAGSTRWEAEGLLHSALCEDYWHDDDDDEEDE